MVDREDEAVDMIAVDLSRASFSATDSDSAFGDNDLLRFTFRSVRSGYTIGDEYEINGKQVRSGSQTRPREACLRRAYQVEIVHHNTVYRTGNIWDMEPQSPCMKQEQHQADCKAGFRY